MGLSYSVGCWVICSLTILNECGWWVVGKEEAEDRDERRGFMRFGKRNGELRGGGEAEGGEGSGNMDRGLSRGRKIKYKGNI